MSFAWTSIAPQHFPMNIVKCQPVLNTVRTGICCRKSFWMVRMAIALSVLRTYFQRTKLVERYCRAVGCGPVYIPANQFFLDLSLGSLHSFHVFVRLSLTFFSCSIVRSVSILIEDIIFSLIRYSRSFSKDQRLNGQPRRSGGHLAVSAIKALPSSVNSVGLPERGFGSKALKARSLHS